MIWVGLGLSLAGIGILTLFNLLWAAGDSRLRDLGEKVGLGLLLMGLTLSVLATGWFF